MALGTDSGGSLRRPATVCGVSTMKATYGRVSTWGILTTNRNGDHVGPLARSVADCAFTLSFLAGADPNDPVTLAAPPPPSMYPTLASAKGRRPFARMVFGVTTSEPTVGELDPGVRAVYERFLARMSSMGATLKEVVSPARVGLGSGGPSPEALEFQLRWFAERGDLYQAPARQSALNTLANQDNGTIKSYYRSLVARAAYIEAWKKVFSDNRLDALLTPAITVETPGRDKPLAEFGPNIRGYWNTLGFPVLGIPAGYSPDTGMPVGVQIAGAPFTESELFSIGLEYEARFDEHTAIPTPFR
jgi:aspartyl-tRNA(Asn)/glutamyl-tRNA(Gln) amidotransferase subunit A